MSIELQVGPAPLKGFMTGYLEALSLVEVRVLDHFVVGDSITSMAERGLL